MSLFDHSRKPLLEFLRNLTPQVLLGSTARVLYERLDFRHWDISNWIPTLAFWGATAIALLAFVANQSLLTESLMDYYDSRSAAVTSVRRLYRRTGSHWKAALGMFKREPTVVLVLALILAISQVAWFVVVYAVASAARNAFR